MTCPGRTLWLCMGMIGLIALFISGAHGTEYNVAFSNIDDVLSGASPGDMLYLSPGDNSAPLHMDTSIILTILDNGQQLTSYYG